MNIRAGNAERYATALVLEHAVANEALLREFCADNDLASILGMKAVEVKAVHVALGIASIATTAASAVGKVRRRRVLYFTYLQVSTHIV